VRTCIGCRGAGERDELLRVVAADAGEVVVDLAATSFGRGAWVHPRPECIVNAASRGLSKAFGGHVRTSAPELFAAVRAAADRRVAGLLAAARASGNVALGSDAVKEALQRGRARRVVVAGDGRASVASLPPSVAGMTTIWGTKEILGAATGRGATAVVAILDEGLSAAIARAVALTSLEPAPTRAAGRSTAHLEVR
jgi:predicted RNA-binding protein YlxR (DUF448 family)/ribosomal protein L30E